MADIGAGSGRLSLDLIGKDHDVIATEASAKGLDELRRRTANRVIGLFGDGLLPLKHQMAVDAIVVSGMGSNLIVHILGQRHLLPYSPVFLIQPVQGILAVRRYLYENLARIHRGLLVADHTRIYASWEISFDGIGAQMPMFDEFFQDPLFPELCSREQQFRRHKLTFPLSQKEYEKTWEELGYWDTIRS
ncbi:MAG: class I SAM-dependent methyltransferase [Firmicutes bacterium]|nr:class I SAM-dependent methyltransferase [Bacillota bacterium]